MHNSARRDVLKETRDMFKRWDSLYDEVAEYLGEFCDQFEIDAIVDELVDMGTDSIDEMDPDEFQMVIQSHEKEA